MAAMTSTDLFTRLRAVEERRPALVALSAALLAAGIVIGAILLQVRETETAQTDLTYQQCASVQDHANRLACYDDVTRQTSLLSAPKARRMSFGELLGAQRSNQASSPSAPQKIVLLRIIELEAV